MIALKWNWKRILLNIQNEINMYKPRKREINANWNQNDMPTHTMGKPIHKACYNPHLRRIHYSLLYNIFCHWWQGFNQNDKKFHDSQESISFNFIKLWVPKCCKFITFTCELWWRNFQLKSCIPYKDLGPMSYCMFQLNVFWPIVFRYWWSKVKLQIWLSSSLLIKI